jgi:hypothetical protein
MHSVNNSAETSSLLCTLQTARLREKYNGNKVHAVFFSSALVRNSVSLDKYIAKWGERGKHIGYSWENRKVRDH